jgi:hypothetical protein
VVAAAISEAVGPIEAGMRVGDIFTSVAILLETEAGNIEAVLESF